MAEKQSQSELAAWLMQECERRNLSWREASLRAKLNAGAISAIIGGQAVGLKTAEHLARFFNIPVEEVLRMGGRLQPRNEAVVEEIVEIYQKLGPQDRTRLRRIAEALLTLAKETE